MEGKFYTIPVESDTNQQPFDEARFRQLYYYEPPPKPSFTSRIKEEVQCDTNTLLNVFPILKWLPRCKKKDIISDIVAGLTVAVMHIPQGMAYALLGGVPPVVGIYMAFFPVLVYIVMGTSHHVSMGTFAVVCMMVGKDVELYAHSEDDDGHHHHSTAYTPMEVATAVCLIVGIWQVLLSMLRLGSLSVLLSRTLVSGFTTGAAVHVLTSQIRNLLGIKVKRYSGPLKVIYTYVDLLSNLANLNATATILSASFIIFLVIFNELVKPLIQKKLKRTVPIPIELLIVITGTLLSKYLDMKDTYGLAVIDNVPKGLPEPTIPPLELLPKLLVDGLIIAIVAVSINLSLASIFAQKQGYDIDGNQEILASGVGNVFSAFFSCMPYAASLSRSLIQVSVGGKTQLTSAVSAGTLVLVLLFVGPFFEPLPYCVLSTIIVVALKGMFKQFFELPAIYRNSKLDAFVWVVTFLSVVILNIDYGLGVGLVASVTTLLLQNQKFEVVPLGKVPNTQIYLDATHFKKAEINPNILMLRIVGGLHFANVPEVKREITRQFNKFRKDLPVGLLNQEKQNRCMTFVLDLSCVPFVDPSAIQTLNEIHDDVKKFQTCFLISGCLPEVYEALTESEYFEDFPKSLIFHSLQDAEDFAKKLQNRRTSGGVISVFL